LDSANCFADPNSDRSPLYDVRNPAGASREGQRMRSDVSRTIIRGTLFKAMHRSSISSGGARRDRTDDLMLAKHALSQLSYGPVPEDECCCRVRRMRSIKVVGLGRLELPTSRLSSARSNQLSYKPLTTRSLARAHRLSRQMHRTSASPWRVFVREERETKTAKSRQWSSPIWRSMAPDVSKTIR
jgi:hypothetical protein